MNNDMNFNNNKNDGFAIPSAPQYEGYENNYNEQRLDESVKETSVDELKADIVAHGRTVAGSVSSKASYLINNDINSTSSKNQKAKSLNVPIITEEEFLKKFFEK